MTPQLRQAIKILQLARAELETLIDQEAADNPLVERYEQSSLSDASPRPDEEDKTVTNGGGSEEEKASPVHADIDWKRYLDNSTEGVSVNCSTKRGRLRSMLRRSCGRRYGLSRALINASTHCGWWQKVL